MGTSKRVFRQLMVEPDTEAEMLRKLTGAQHMDLIFSVRVEDLLELVGETWEEDTAIQVRVACAAEDDPRETAALEFSFDETVLS